MNSEFRLTYAALILLLLTGGSPQSPRDINLLIPEKTFSAEGPDKSLRVSFDDLNLQKVLNMDVVTEDALKLMPKWMKNLDGKSIRIRGYIYPPFKAKELEEFVLAADESVCTFGRDVKVYDICHVKLKSGTTADYDGIKPIDIEGVFHVAPVNCDGDLMQMYAIDDAVVVRK